MMAAKTNAALAVLAWRRMFDVFMRSAPQRIEVLQRHGLTPNDSRALFTLTKEGTPIGRLAREWKCDASTATWLVDRLERAGLAERVSSATDRRSKLVRLTAGGRAMRARLTREYHRPPPEFASLTHAELTTLARILKKMS